jgi:catalase
MDARSAGSRRDFSQDPELVEDGIRVMEAYTGSLPGYRRAHARGHGFIGTFVATPEVASLTTAMHMQGGEVPVVVRMSNGAGSPYAPDVHPGGRGTTIGLAVRFQLPDGSYCTWASPNMLSFPARTPEEFIKITTAQRPSSKTGRPSLRRIAAYAATRRYTLPGLRSLLGQPPRRSFATTEFNGLHAYWLVNHDGQRQKFRYHWTPRLTVHRDLTAEEMKTWPPHFLIEEMTQRLARGPAVWDLVFELGGPDDPTHDVTAAWPASTPRIHAGTLQIDGEHPNQAEVETMVFDPANVPPGIECSDDPLLAYRSAVYTQSHLRRTHETKPVDHLYKA